ncbi:MAG: putative transposase [Zhongshania sp.]
MLIEKLKESHAVALIYDVFGVDHSSYKYWVKRPKMPSLKRIKLLSEVRSAHQDSNGSAGARTIATIVTDPGIQLSRHRTTRVMKELELDSRIWFVAVTQGIFGRGSAGLIWRW